MTRPIALALVAAALAVAQTSVFPNSPAAIQTPTGTSSMEGTVVNDATSEPIKKAQVMLYGVPGSAPVAFTDASGSFAFHKLPAGSYTVSAMRDGYDQNRANLLGDGQKTVTITADENKTGVELRLPPNGSISGRLVDENGDPAPRCNVGALEAGSPGGTASRMRGGGQAMTDDHGEYRISNLPAGRYIVYQHCFQTLAAPHGFMEQGDPRTPVWAWAPGVYGGADGGGGASAVTVRGGDEVHGIDFRLRTENAYSVSIALLPDDPGVDLRNASVRLEPEDRTLARMGMHGASRMNNGGTWRASGAVPGSYVAIADLQQGEKRWHGEAPFVVEDRPPDLVRVPLTAGTSLSGDVQVDKSDAQENQPARRLGSVSLAPLDSSRGMPYLNAPITADGSFTFAGVIPGRYQLQVVGAINNIQSVTVGGHEVSPRDINVGAGASGALHVTISLKQVGLQVSVDNLKPDRQTWVILLPKDVTEPGPGLNPPMMAATQSPVTLQVPPGEYVAYAVECQQPWPLLQSASTFHALAGLGKAVEVKEDGDASITVSVIGHDELKRAVDQELQ